MAPRSTETVKRSAVKLAKLAACDSATHDVTQNAVQDEMESNGIEKTLSPNEAAEADEGKFAKLAADFVVRKNRPVLSTQAPLPAEHLSSDLENREFADQAARFLVRKGEAGPSMIGSRPGEYALALVSNGWDEPVAMVYQTSQETFPSQTRSSRFASEESQAHISIVEKEEVRRDDLESALLKAEVSWKANEAERLATVEAQWQERFTNALAEAERDTNEIELQRLRAESAMLRAALADREMALARECVTFEQTRERWQRDAQEALSRAEMSWRAGEAERLAAAEAQWHDTFTKALANGKSRAEKELNHSVAEERSRLRAESTAMQTALADRDVALTKAHLAIEQVKRESQETLVKAEKCWKAAEVERLAANEAQWHERYTKALAEARSRAEHERDQSVAEERNRLRAESTAMQTALADRDVALTKAHLAIEQVKREAQESLVKAEKCWKAAEVERLVANEAQWHERSTKALAEARSRAEHERDQSVENERNRLRLELASMQEALAERERALSQAGMAVKEARECAARDVQEALKNAELSWRASEAERLAADDARWQEKMTKAVAEARTEVTKLRDHGNEAELNRLRAESAAMQAALADREMALARECVAIEQTRESWRQEAKDALSRAEASWKAEEAKRLAAVQAHWQERFTRALSEARTKADGSLAQGETLELHRLREEYAALRTNLAERETTAAREYLAIERARESWQREAQEALSNARMSWKTEESRRFANAEAQWRKQSSELKARIERAEKLNTETGDRAIGDTRELQTSDNGIVLKPNRIGFASGAAGRHADVRNRGHLVRNLVVAVSLTASAVVLYPRVALFLPFMGASIGATPDRVLAPAPASASPSARPTIAFVNHAANVRVEPSANAAIAFTLQHGVNVTIVERRGVWTRIRVDADRGKTELRQGWMSNSFLEDAGGGLAELPAGKTN